MTTDALKLAEELERAPEGSRELSDRFLLAMGWERVTLDTSTGGFDGVTNYSWCSPDNKCYAANFRPDPTRNMQDTIEAVPEGLYWFVDAQYRSSKPQAGINDADGGPLFAADAATPQLALCAAILKMKDT